MKFILTAGMVSTILFLILYSPRAHSETRGLDCRQTNFGNTECHTLDKVNKRTGKFSCLTNPRTKVTTCTKIY